MITVSGRRRPAMLDQPSFEVLLSDSGALRRLHMARAVNDPTPIAPLIQLTGAAFIATMTNPAMSRSNGVTSRMARQHCRSGPSTRVNSKRAHGGSVGWAPTGFGFLTLMTASGNGNYVNALPN